MQLREQQHTSIEKQKLETLVNSIDGIVWEADGETFQFTFVSPQAERILGRRAAVVALYQRDVTGRPLEELMPRDVSLVLNEQRIDLAAMRGGVLSFAFAGLHPHDISQVLDSHGNVLDTTPGAPPDTPNEPRPHLAHTPPNARYVGFLGVT